MSDTQLQEVLHGHPDAGRESLIPILQEVQDAVGFLSREAIAPIGQRLGLPASKVYGVATFYSQFRFRGLGRYHIQVCRGTACHVKGSAVVLEAIRRELAIEPGQTARDGGRTRRVPPAAACRSAVIPRVPSGRSQDDGFPIRLSF